MVDDCNMWRFNGLADGEVGLLNSEHDARIMSEMFSRLKSKKNVQIY